MNTTGFPSPAQGYEQEQFDFNQILLPHPAADYAMRYTGSDLPDDYIRNGDIIIVDCTRKPAAGSIAVIQKDGSFVVGHAGDPCELVFGTVIAVVRLE